MADGTASALGERYKEEHRQWRRENRRRKVPFFAVYKPILEILPRLRPGAVKLFVFLGLNAHNETGELWWGVDRIAEALDVSERTVRAWLDELEGHGLIRRLRVHPGATMRTYLRPYPPGERGDEGERAAGDSVDAGS